MRLEEMRFEILICDLNLPDGDGLELAREVKKLQPLKAIAMTGRDSEQERIAGVKAGFDCYLTKPIDFRDLQKALRT
jgi:DNA-binding response OmpR family regulator